MSDDPLLEPATDLREIRRLAGLLREQAVYKADDKQIPGGEALAMLAPVASPEAVANRIDGLERWNLDHQAQERRDTSHLDDLADDPVPLSDLLFWSEQLRYDLDAVFEPEPHHPYPTLDSEAKWLGNQLSTIHATEPHWSDFARDVHGIRRRLEAILREGERETKGITCPHCRSAAMVRTEHDRSRPRGCNGHGALGLCPVHRCNCGDRGGLIEEWTCSECHHKLAGDAYGSAVFRDYIAHAEYLPGKYIERRTNVPHVTVRVWAHRGHVATDIAVLTDGDVERETVVYCVADVEARLSGEAATG